MQRLRPMTRLVHPGMPVRCWPAPVPLDDRGRTLGVWCALAGIGERRVSNSLPALLSGGRCSRSIRRVPPGATVMLVINARQ